MAKRKRYPTPVKYTPQNPHKYVGSSPIICRSSWETYFCKHLDRRSDVIQWASESLRIPYLSPKDGEMHRYFPDFIVEYQLQDGTTSRQVIEIKPYKETIASTSRIMKTRMRENLIHQVNEAKWAAARKVCKDAGYGFIILTERELFG